MRAIPKAMKKMVKKLRMMANNQWKKQNLLTEVPIPQASRNKQIIPHTRQKMKTNVCRSNSPISPMIP
jgi:hypothetical protein